MNIQCFEVVLVTLQLNDLYILWPNSKKTRAIALVASRSIYERLQVSIFDYIYVRLELGMAQMVVGFSYHRPVSCVSKLIMRWH